MVKPDIEITPAMIEVGVMVLRDSGRLDSEADGPDQALVWEILHQAFGKLIGSKTRGQPL